MNSWQVLKNASDNIGVKAMAADMNLSASLIYKWCQPCSGPDSGALNPLDRIVKICNLTDDTRPIAWLCQQFNAVMVANSPDDACRIAVLEATQQVLKEFSELLAAVSQSYEDDGHINRAEAATIRVEWEELKSVMESFVIGCESGHYDG